MEGWRGWERRVEDIDTQRWMSVCVFVCVCVWFSTPDRPDDAELMYARPVDLTAQMPPEPIGTS